MTRIAALVFIGLVAGVGVAAADNSDQVQGTGTELKGDVEKGVGDATGNQKLQQQGTADKTSGELQDTWGKIKSTAHDIGTAIENKIEGK
jgi:uncharacterized protein YjbJ (UPF0337 family)